MSSTTTILFSIAFWLYLISLILSSIAYGHEPSKASRIICIIRWIVTCTASLFLCAGTITKMIILKNDTGIAFIDIFVLICGILIFYCSILGLRKFIKDNDSQKGVIFSIQKKFGPKSEFNLINAFAFYLNTNSIGQGSDHNILVGGFITSTLSNNSGLIQK